MTDIQIPIEKNPVLLQKYGLATALYASADYLLGEMIRLKGGLHKANQDVVNALMENKTMGPKIGLAKEIGVREELSSLFPQVLEDRNLLAHSPSVETPDGTLGLMAKSGFQDLTETVLDGIIERARNFSKQIHLEISAKFRPMRDLPPGALTAFSSSESPDTQQSSVVGELKKKD